MAPPRAAQWKLCTRRGHNPSRKVTSAAGRPQSWRSAIASGSPVVMGLWVTEAYWQLGEGETVHPEPGSGHARDGHAVVVLGCSETGLLCKDSRGPGFGDDGTWWFPYSLLGRGLIPEAWMVQAITYDD